MSDQIQSLPYRNLATSAKAEVGRKKMTELFTTGRAAAANTLKMIMDNQPEDMVAPAKAFRFIPGDATIDVKFEKLDGVRNLHTNAFQQIVGRGALSVPWRFVGDLIQTDAEILQNNSMAKIEADKREPWAMKHLAEFLNDSYAHASDKYLVRSVGTQIRGVLSDRYKRIDSAPVLEAFIEEASKLGAVPVDAKFMGTHFSLKMMLPHLFEPVENEVLGIGLAIHNSDYGDGAYWLRMFIMRALCANGMMGEDIMRKIHLGSRLEGDIAFSRETYELDTRAVVSASRDLIQQSLTPDVVDHRMQLIAAAASETIDSNERIEAMRKASRLTKEESARLRDLYSSADVEMLPPGNTAWRLSNALALLAHEATDSRSLEMESMAGEIAQLSLPN